MYVKEAPLQRSKTSAKAAGWAFVCLPVFIVAVALAASVEPRSTGVTRNSDGLRFVFADLDGDRIPDLAQVETKSQKWRTSDYSIRVKLSGGRESAIGVSGPLGGLRLTARDMNGDDNVDLVVTADADPGFVRVLLNDGHGNFSPSAPEQFTGLESEQGKMFTLPAAPQADRATLARPSPEPGIPGSCRGGLMFSAQEVSPEPAQKALCGGIARASGRSPPAGTMIS